MSKHWCWLASMGWLITLPVWALDPPKTPPPQLGEVVLGEAGQLHVTEFEIHAFPVTKQVQKVVDGVARTEVFAVWERIISNQTGDVPPSSYFVKTVGGEVIVTESVADIENVWAPQKEYHKFSLADCQLIGHDGQPVAGANLAAMLAEGKPILWLEQGMTLDTRFCQFLKADALIVSTPARPVSAHEIPLSCAPQLDFQWAQATGDQLLLSRMVVESVVVS